jgi:peptidoglycan/LPS O-acetylase OafA/YrhL
MWSLSVQEQYYVIFPLILIASRGSSGRSAPCSSSSGASPRSRCGGCGRSTSPAPDPSRVYYGTDTRIFEVLIGVLGAILLSERAFAFSRGRKHTGLLARYDKALGWAGLASLALLFY